MVCWGSNAYGESTIPALLNPVLVSAGGGNGHTCALDGNGVHCWGANNHNQRIVPDLTIDPDGDGVTNQNGLDAFPFDATEDTDTDSDGTGNNADTDDDNDGTLDTSDAFPLDASEQADSDSDGVGDNTDVFPLDATETADTDTDGVGDNGDNCSTIGNADQTNTDADDLGNACDDDDDNDGLVDDADAFPLDATEHADSDGDGVGNNADAFPFDATETIDTDSDSIGNNADTDDDGDGIADGSDAFPLDASETVDTDLDGIGNNADTDDDNDGVDDSIDAFPLDAFETLDTDSDGTGDNADLDDDNDGYSDEQEAIDGTDPLNPFSCSQGCFSFDIDADEKLEADALTDGLLVIRHLFGFSGDALIANATSNVATRHDANEITSYLNDAESELDIDGDGEAGALTDGLILIRYLFGFSGDALISGAVSENAERTTAEQIEAYISERIPIL